MSSEAMFQAIFKIIMIVQLVYAIVNFLMKYLAWQARNKLYQGVMCTLLTSWKCTLIGHIQNFSLKSIHGKALHFEYAGVIINMIIAKDLLPIIYLQNCSEFK